MCIVVTDWKTMQKGQIRLSKLFQATLVGKDGESAQQSKLGIHDHSNYYGRKRMKKRMERSKLDIINHFRALWKMLVGKDREKCKMTKVGHSE